MCVCVGFMHDVTGRYDMAFYILACIALTALLLMIIIYIIDRRSRKLTKSNITETYIVDTKC